MPGPDPQLLVSVLRAAGFGEAAESVERQAGQESEGTLGGKVEALERRLGEAELRTASADDQARRAGEAQLDHLRERRIGPFGWLTPGNGDDGQAA